MGLAFESAELQDMNLVDINHFIDRWHDAVAVTLQEMGRFDGTLADLATYLKSEIRHRRALRNLAVNPLLCAMLCALNRDRRRQLPSVRLELYEACVHMLLERRDLERPVDLSDYPNLTYTDKKTLLRDLAYWMLCNGWSEVSLEKAEKRLEDTMRFMPNLPSNATASKIRRFFIERSGLVRQPVKGQLDFAHRTFQEYLAAQEAIDKDDVEQLIRHAHLDEWREVIIVAVGVARRSEAADLLTKLIKRGDQEPNYHNYLHLLAMASLESVRRLEPAIITKVKKRMAHIVPPQNEWQSRDLANTGELAVPYLHFQPEYSSKIAVFCVKTLNQIGGEAALEALKSYVEDGSEEVQTALLNAWDSFDRQEFTRQILKSLVGQRTTLVSKTHFSSLEGFEQVPHLERLELGTTSLSSTASDLTPLKNFTNLRHLTLLNFTALRDLRPLSKLSTLTSLHL